MTKNKATKAKRPAVRVLRLVSRLRDLVKTMRTNATALKSGKGYAHPELQSERNASAHSMEFWALRIEEQLAANTDEAHPLRAESAQPKH